MNYFHYISIGYKWVFVPRWLWNILQKKLIIRYRIEYSWKGFIRDSCLTDFSGELYRNKKPVSWLKERK